MTTNKNFTLQLQFDGNQVSDVLLYEFELNGKNAMTKSGRYSGVIQFNQGDTVNVEVTMTADAGVLPQVKSVEIVSLDLVARPNINKTVQCFSPFDEVQATKSLVKQWSTVSYTPATPNAPATWVSTWQGPELTVVAETGYWQLAGFLGVSVEQIVGGQSTNVLRVLSFDPETGSGAGNDPD